jgi:hypothetical protein
MSTLIVNTIQPLTGTTVTIPSDLTVTGNITGTLSGTVTNAATASYVDAANINGTITNAATASYVDAANINGTITNAATASYVDAANINGTITNAATASYVAAANVDGTVANAATALYAATSSYYDGASIDAEIYFSPTNTSTDFPILFSSITSNLGGYGYPSYDQQPSTFTYNPSTNTFKLVGLTIIASSLPTSEPSTSGQLWLSGSAGSNSKILCVRN